MRRIPLLAGALLLAALVAPTAASAVPVPMLGTVTVVPDYVAGEVAMSVQYGAGIDTIRFVSGDTVLQTMAVGLGSTAATTTGVSLPAAMSLSVQGFCGPAYCWSSTTTVDPAAYRPGLPTITNMPYRKVVGQFVNVASSNAVPFTTVKIRSQASDPWTIANIAKTNSHTYQGLEVPRGPARIDVIHENGFGSSLMRKHMVYWVGAWPSAYTRSVVIDKSYIAAYHIYNGRVLAWFPVCMGQSGMPTPNGYFRVGKAYPASGAWGVLRRRLYRLSGAGTMYFIHGTNEPDSIGTFSSHGCVRMYNYAIRYFSATVPNGTLVYIHN